MNQPGFSFFVLDIALCYITDLQLVSHSAHGAARASHRAASYLPLSDSEGGFAPKQYTIVSRSCAPNTRSFKIFAMPVPLEAALSGLSTFVVGEQGFCIQHSPKGTVHTPLPPSGSWAPFQLATIINWNKERITDNDLDQVKLDFAARDDVWNPSFLEGKVFSLIAVMMWKGQLLIYSNHPPVLYRCNSRT